MNLIDGKIENCNIAYFRSFQHGYIVDYIENMVDYILLHGFQSDGTRQLEVVPSLTYHHYNYNALETYKFSLVQRKSSSDKYLFKLAFPKLVDNCFYIIHGVKYVPAIYAIDAPITIKKSSIMLNSMFFPITIYYKDKRVIIMGHNIALDSVLQLLFGEYGEEYASIMQVDYREQDDESILNYFANTFKCDNNRKSILFKLNSLFFDNWTYELYSKFYDFEISLENAIYHALQIMYNDIHFTDVRFKRLVFIEPLLRPMAQAVSYSIKRIIDTGANLSYLNLATDAIIKNFIKNLNMSFFYDTVNGFTSILTHKSSFKNPYKDSPLPKSISSIHETHKGRICPVTISNLNPGETVSLVPSQIVDFKYGLFSIGATS